jgi:hypothetical protein
MSGMQLARKRWLHGDRRILTIFALYGLAAGIMMYALSVSEDTGLDYFVYMFNLPAMIFLLYVEWNIANPAGLSILFHPATIVAGTVAVWSFIGLIAYLLVRMFRMGP